MKTMTIETVNQAMKTVEKENITLAVRFGLIDVATAIYLRLKVRKHATN